MITIGAHWRRAIESIVVKHIDPTCKPVFEVLGDEFPELFVAVQGARNTCAQDDRFSQLVVSTVKLTYWPGETLACAWVAAAWSGYIQHEALELVTVCGIRPLDPHLPPFSFDKGLRCGFPVELTPQSLEATLALVMDPVLAAEMVRNGGAAS